MNFVVGLVANSVDLRSKSFARYVRIVIEEQLNFIVVFLKQKPDLLLLFRRQFQISRKASKFLVNRLSRVGILPLLMR